MVHCKCGKLLLNLRNRHLLESLLVLFWKLGNMHHSAFKLIKLMSVFLFILGNLKYINFVGDYIELFLLVPIPLVNLSFLKTCFGWDSLYIFCCPMRVFKKFLFKIFDLLLCLSFSLSIFIQTLFWFLSIWMKSFTFLSLLLLFL